MRMIALPGPLRAGEGPDSREPAWGLCKQATARAEAARDLPPHLLIAIARTESGRWHAASSETLAWPWTVMAEGKGRFLPSKAAAIEEVRRLQARGIRNIDVGCLQVNLHYHPDAFASLETAFDPEANAAYAADFLVRLREEARSWTRSEEHTSELQSLMRHPYADFCLKT